VGAFAPLIGATARSGIGGGGGIKAPLFRGRKAAGANKNAKPEAVTTRTEFIIFFIWEEATPSDDRIVEADIKRDGGVASGNYLESDPNSGMAPPHKRRTLPGV